jgi:hypothetical protein
VVAHKDVVLALLGASAALSGLLLMFLGLVVGAYGGLPGDTPRSVKTPYRRTGTIILVAFAIGIVCLVLATCWLLQLTGGQGLYVATVCSFIAQLVAICVATVWTLGELLWD